MKRTIRIKAKDEDTKVELTMKVDAKANWDKKVIQNRIDRLTDSIYEGLFNHFHAKDVTIQKKKKKKRGKK